MIKNNMTDEEIDAIIKSRLAQFPRYGGTTSSKKVGWNEDELALMDNVIMNYISKKGCSREITAQNIKQRWGVNIGTARRYVTDAIKRMANSFQEDTDELRRIWLERVENILESAISTGNKEAAIRSLDLMAKSMGFYKESKDINLQGDGIIKFDFQ